MSVVIKLFKAGKSSKGIYHFKIGVSDKRRSNNTRFIEQVGVYDPSRKPAFIKVDKEKALRWLKNGAQPSDTVKSLFKKEGVVLS